MNTILQTVLQILICVFIAAGTIWNIKRIIGVSKRRKSRGAGAILVLDADDLGFAAENTVRALERNLSERGGIFVKRILLVSSGNISDEQKNICKILSGEYENLAYFEDRPSHNLIRLLSE